MLYGQKYTLKDCKKNIYTHVPQTVIAKIFQRGYLSGGGFVMSPAQVTSSSNLLIGGILVSSTDGVITFAWTDQLKDKYGTYPLFWAYYNGQLQPLTAQLNDTDNPTEITFDLGTIPDTNLIIVIEKPDSVTPFTIADVTGSGGILTIPVTGFNVIWAYFDGQSQIINPVLDDNDVPTSVTIDLGTIPATTTYIGLKLADEVLTYTPAEISGTGGVITITDTTLYGANALYQVYYEGAYHSVSPILTPTTAIIDLGAIPTDDTHILILNGGGQLGITELLGTANPVSIEFGGNSRDKMLPLKGSKAYVRAMVSPEFDLEQIYTDDEREYYTEIDIQSPNDQFTINWSNFDNPSGNHVESFLQVYRNNVLIVNSFTSESGTFKVTRGDNVSATVYSVASWPTAQCGLQLEFTSLPTLRTTVNATPLSRNNIVIDKDTTIAGYSTYSASLYTAIRSDVFYNQTSGYPVAFTKSYTDSTQSGADAIAAADTTFYTDGQAYADSYPIGFPAAFRGFMIPDGMQQSWAGGPTSIEMNFVDGIGILKNLLFAKESGDLYVGKLTPKDIIVNCLTRLGIPDMNIYIRAEIFEEDMDETDDPLVQCLFQAETYFLSTQTKPLDCGQVLESVIRNFELDFRQNNGEWYVTQIDAQYESGAHKYFMYSYLTGELLSTPEFDFTRTLGGTCSAPELIYALRDQLKIIDRAYRGQIIQYEFKSAQNINNNQNLTPIPSGSGYIWPGWTVDPLGSGNVNPGPGNNGARMDSDAVRPADPPVLTMTSEDIAVQPGDLLTFNLNFNNTGYVAFCKFQVTFNNGADTYWLDISGAWILGSPTFIYVSNYQQLANLLIGPTAYYLYAADTDQSVEIVAQAIPNVLSGLVNIILYNYDYSQNDTISADETNSPDYPNLSGTTIWNLAKASFAVSPDAQGQPLGLFFIARNAGNATYTPPILNVLNADDDTAKYVGTIYREDATTPTVVWHRRGSGESFPLLTILAESYVRMYQLPFRICQGSVLGWFPQLTRFIIDGFPGVYMTVGVNYELVPNLHQATLIQISNQDVFGAPPTVIETDYGQYQNGDLPTL